MKCYLFDAWHGEQFPVPGVSDIEDSSSKAMKSNDMPVSINQMEGQHGFYEGKGIW